MTTAVLTTNILNNLAYSLVVEQKYPTVEEALKEFALAAVRKKIASYQRRIRSLEHRYGTNFETFTVRLRGQATPAEEDDWLAWRSALLMKTDWQQSYQKLLKHGTY